MPHVTVPSILATGVTPELSLITVVSGLGLFAMAVWFLVISYDLSTSFRRFRKLDERERVPAAVAWRTTLLPSQLSWPVGRSKAQV